MPKITLPLNGNPKLSQPTNIFNSGFSRGDVVTLKSVIPFEEPRNRQKFKHPTMEKQSRLDVASEAKKIGDVVLAEQIYHEILSTSAGNNESALREQESALIQLGEVYRDQKCDHLL